MGRGGVRYVIKETYSQRADDIYCVCLEGIPALFIQKLVPLGKDASSSLAPCDLGMADPSIRPQ